MKNHIATLRRIATIEKRAAVFPSIKARLERVMNARRATNRARENRAALERETALIHTGKEAEKKFEQIVNKL